MDKNLEDSFFYKTRDLGLFNIADTDNQNKILQFGEKELYTTNKDEILSAYLNAAYRYSNYLTATNRKKAEENIEYLNNFKLSLLHGNEKRLMNLFDELKLNLSYIPKNDNSINFNINIDSLLSQKLNWGFFGGLASGIAGPFAGVLVANDIIEYNNYIDKQNSNLIKNAILVQSKMQDKYNKEYGKYISNSKKLKNKIDNFIEYETFDVYDFLEVNEIHAFYNNETNNIVIRFSTHTNTNFSSDKLDYIKFLEGDEFYLDGNIMFGIYYQDKKIGTTSANITSFDVTDCIHHNVANYMIPSDAYFLDFDFSKYGTERDIWHHGFKIEVENINTWIVDTSKEKSFKKTKKENSDPFSIGNKIEFGKHKWRILSKDSNNIALLMCDDCVNVMQYGKENNVMKNDNRVALWQDSDIRTYLNTFFYNTAFNKNERDIIKTTKTKNTIIEKGLLIGYKENDYFVDDNIFILSKEELDKYLPETSDRIISFSNSDDGLKQLIKNKMHKHNITNDNKISYWLRATSSYKNHYFHCGKNYKNGEYITEYAIESAGNIMFSGIVPCVNIDLNKYISLKEGNDNYGG